MKQHQLAAILIACATVLAAGSYVLFSDTEEGSMHRAEIQEPSTDIPEAPSWVNNGQEVKPDYTPSTADAQNATPVKVDTDQSNKTQVIEFVEDKMVTFTFVESLADFFLHRFHPQNTMGKPATLASAKALNMYYGQELDGFSVSGNDIRMSRKAVLDYAFTPTMVKTLYNLYAPVLMAHIVDTAGSDERKYTVKNSSEQRVLTNKETIEMLRLNARKIDQTASIFRTIGTNPSITEMAGKYLMAAKAVERANVQFQNAMADNKNTSKASLRLKQAIQQRERIKAQTISLLKKTSPECSEAELFYLAQWAYRRVLNGPTEKLETFGVVADVLDDLAKRFRTQADEIK